MILVQPFEPVHWPGVWSVLEPIFREGTTYALPRDISEEAARMFWTGPGRETWVAMDGDKVAGTYFLRANQTGGGAHVCNCGYATSEPFRGRGIASLMCQHSQERALEAGYRAMQFNFVVSTNEGAVRLWKRLGFNEVGRLPDAFEHPQEGFVDALVMFKRLL